MNWWHSIDIILPEIPLSDEKLSLSPAQSHRLEFYRALIRSSRMIGGIIAVVIPSSDSTSDAAGAKDENKKDPPVATLIWLPPKVRQAFNPLLRSGFYQSALRAFGVRGGYRFWHFEDQLQKLYAESLSPLGYEQSDGGFVQILATDPKHAGHGYGAKLLDWQVRRHWEAFSNAPKPPPVFLDTVSEVNQRIYKKLGFRRMGSRSMYTGRDARGLPFGRDVSREEREDVGTKVWLVAFILEKTAVGS